MFGRLSTPPTSRGAPPSSAVVCLRWLPEIAACEPHAPPKENCSVATRQRVEGLFRRRSIGFVSSSLSQLVYAFGFIENYSAVKVFEEYIFSSWVCDYFLSILWLF